MKVYEALLASRFLPNFACAAPYRLSKTKIEFSRLGQIWSFAYASSFVVLLWTGNVKLPASVDGLRDILDSMTFWLQFILAAFSVMKDGFCQGAIIDFVRSIEVYDEKSGYGRQPLAVRENKNVRFWSFFHSFVILIFAALRTANSIFYSPNGPHNYFINMANEIAVMVIDNSTCMFAVFSTLIGMRFRHLNSMIEEDRNIVGISCASISNPEYIRSLYSSLVRTGEKLNNHYSSRLFLWTARTFLETVTRVHNITLVKVVSMHSLTRILTRLFPFVVALFIVTIACQFTVDQANRAPSLLLAKNIRLTARIDRGRKEIFTMSLYMALRPFAFTALGFFDVDLTLTFAVFTAFITYIALCVQTHSKS